MARRAWSRHHDRRQFGIAAEPANFLLGKLTDIAVCGKVMKHADIPVTTSLI
jgi:hypothetical protein